MFSPYHFCHFLCLSLHEMFPSVSFCSVQSLSHVWLFVIAWPAACQASLSITNSWSLLKLMSIELVMPSNHLTLGHLLYLMPSIFPSTRVFSNELVSLIFLKRSLIFPILLFSSISLHWSLRKAFLSLLDILWNSTFKWVYLSFSPLPLTSVLFSAICEASSDNYFAFLHFFFLRMVFITASCTMSWTSVHSSSGTLSIRFIPWDLFVTS